VRNATKGGEGAKGPKKAASFARRPRELLRAALPASRCQIAEPMRGRVSPGKADLQCCMLVSVAAAGQGVSVGRWHARLLPG